MYTIQVYLQYTVPSPIVQQRRPKMMIIMIVIIIRVIYLYRIHLYTYILPTLAHNNNVDFENIYILDNNCGLSVTSVLLACWLLVVGHRSSITHQHRRHERLLESFIRSDHLLESQAHLNEKLIPANDIRLLVDFLSHLVIRIRI